MSINFANNKKIFERCTFKVELISKPILIFSGHVLRKTKVSECNAQKKMYNKN